jgi:hypothetical protein
MKKKTNISPEVSAYMREIGRRGGNKNKEKGKEYFSKISKGEKWTTASSENSK